MKNEKNWNDNKIKNDNDNIQCYEFGRFIEKKLIKKILIY